MFTRVAVSNLCDVNISFSFKSCQCNFDVKGGYTGKLSWNLGKKWGTEHSALGSTAALPQEEVADPKEYQRQCEEFWTSLERAANRLISEGENCMTLTKYKYANEETALRACGEGIMDAGQCNARDKRRKKAAKAKKEGKDATALTDDGAAAAVGLLRTRGKGAVADTFALALLHGMGLVPLSQLGRLQIVRDNPKSDSSIVCSKKKCEVVVKFCVMPPEDAMDVTVPEEKHDTSTEGITESLNVGPCMSKDIRVKEGAEYQTMVQMHQRQLEMEALSTQEKATTETGAVSPATTATQSPGEDNMVVTAFEVSGSIDYNKLIDKFGSKPLTPYLLKRLENVTVKQGTVPRLHRFLRREIFFSHRDIEKICELLEGWYGVDPPKEDSQGMAGTSGGVEKNEEKSPRTPATPCPIYLYTGRGPSSAAMHLGHLVPFLFTAWLQKAFQCPLVIQMTDDEKFLFKGEYRGDAAGDGSGPEPDRTGDDLDRFADLTLENARDIIACDFLPDRTFLFSDLDYVGKMYPNIVRIWKAVTTNQVNGIFGFDGGANIGKMAFPAIQAAPSFGSSFPTVLGSGESRAATLACLIPCAIDQDPYFRLTRDIAHKLVPRHHPLQGKPALIHSKFFPPLQGSQGKMSSSDANSAIFLTDTPEVIEKKIKQHAFSGGQDTKKLQEELGANLETDVSYQWLRFFLEDDEELARIGQDYGSGSGEFWSTGKVKAKLVDVLKVLLKEHQERRSKVTIEVVREWMTERCITAA